MVAGFKRTLKHGLFSFFDFRLWMASWMTHLKKRVFLHNAVLPISGDEDGLGLVMVELLEFVHERSNTAISAHACDLSIYSQNIILESIK